jgi:hypothetical protein
MAEDVPSSENGTRVELIKHISAEIHDEHEQISQFRSRISITAWATPFVILGSFIASGKAQLLSSTGSRRWLGLAVAAYLLTGFIYGIVEARSVRRANQLRRLLAEQCGQPADLLVYRFGEESRPLPRWRFLSYGVIYLALHILVLLALLGLVRFFGV